MPLFKVDSGIIIVFKFAHKKPVSPQSKTATARRSLILPSKITSPYAIKVTQILHIFIFFVVSQS